MKYELEFAVIIRTDDEMFDVDNIADALAKGGLNAEAILQTRRQQMSIGPLSPGPTSDLRTKAEPDSGFPTGGTKAQLRGQ
jgi:hypothetical protein